MTQFYVTVTVSIDDTDTSKTLRNIISKVLLCTDFSSTNKEETEPYRVNLMKYPDSYALNVGATTATIRDFSEILKVDIDTQSLTIHFKDGTDVLIILSPME